MHDADDDRRRPATVHGGRRMLGRGGPARQAHLGRRRGPLATRRRPRARRRCGERDVRVVARRHVRVGRRHAARPRRPALQGELRDGVEPRREESQPRRDRLDRARKELFEEGIEHADVPRPGASGRRGHHRPDRRRRPLGVHVRRRGDDHRAPRTGPGRDPEPCRLRPRVARRNQLGTRRTGDRRS